MKSVILIAAPAAGKGTEARLLHKEYGIPHISTGDILRDKAKEDSSLGHEIADKIGNGKFVSDELIIDILKERIQKDDCSNGYILDGFPRNVSQALAYEKMLEQLNKELGIVIVLDVDKQTAISRITSRVLCPKCKRVYNTSNEEMKPRVDGICDDCNTNLIKREDDNEKTYTDRYNTYVEKTSPLIDFYEKKNILYHVDANKNSEYTNKQVEEVLGSLK